MTPTQFAEQIEDLIKRSSRVETQLVIEAIRLQTEFLYAHHLNTGRSQTLADSSSANDSTNDSRPASDSR